MTLLTRARGPAAVRPGPDRRHWDSRVPGGRRTGTRSSSCPTRSPASSPNCEPPQATRCGTGRVPHRVGGELEFTFVDPGALATQVRAEWDMLPALFAAGGGGSNGSWAWPSPRRFARNQSSTPAAAAVGALVNGRLLLPTADPDEGAAPEQPRTPRRLRRVTRWSSHSCGLTESCTRGTAELRSRVACCGLGVVIVCAAPAPPDDGGHRHGRASPAWPSDPAARAELCALYGLGPRVGGRRATRRAGTTRNMCDHFGQKCEINIEILAPARP